MLYNNNEQRSKNFSLFLPGIRRGENDYLFNIPIDIQEMRSFYSFRLSEEFGENFHGFAPNLSDETICLVRKSVRENVSDSDLLKILSDRFFVDNPVVISFSSIFRSFALHGDFGFTSNVIKFFSDLGLLEGRGDKFSPEVSDDSIQTIYKLVSNRSFDNEKNDIYMFMKECYRRDNPIYIQSTSGCLVSNEGDTIDRKFIINDLNNSIDELISLIVRNSFISGATRNMIIEYSGRISSLANTLASLDENNSLRF